MAILFALSILSVIMVIVMIFAAKAKVESRIASVHLENQQARLLAKSLIPRILLTLEKSPAFTMYPLFSSTYPQISYKIQDPDNPSQQLEKKDPKYLACDWIWKLETTGVFNFDPSKDEGAISGISKKYSEQDNPWDYDPAFIQVLPNWQYIRKPGDPIDQNPFSFLDPGKNRKPLLARFAFITIPQLSGLNPNAIANHVYCRTITDNEKKRNKPEEQLCKLCARKPGVSAAELFFDETLLPSGSLKKQITNRVTKDGKAVASYLRDVFYAGDKYHQPGGNWADIENFIKSFYAEAGLPQSEEDQDKLRDYYTFKKHFQQLFDIGEAGNDDADLEVFWSDDGEGNHADNGVKDDDEFYHRFNLRRNDWDEKGKGEQGYKIDVNYLLRPPKKYEKEDEETIKKNPDSNFDTGGIAWLANWKDGGDWGKPEDTKKQIAANLINYCASASRPVVSDIPPENWLTSLKDPSYTGLKRTLYINELFYNFKIYSNVTVTPKTPPETNDVSLKYYLNYTVLTELVDMYANTLGSDSIDQPTFSAYTPVVKGTISFKCKNPDPSITSDEEKWKECKLEFEKKDGLTFYRLNPPDDPEDPPEIKSYKITKNYGYFGYMATDDKLVMEFTYKKDIPPTEEGQDAEQGLSRISDIKINIDRVLLKRDDSAVAISGHPAFDSPLPEGKKEEYVDYAGLKFNSQDLIPAKSHPQSEDGLHPDSKEGYVRQGHFETADPRQNLRASDWPVKEDKEYINGAVPEFHTVHSMPCAKNPKGGPNKCLASFPLYYQGKSADKMQHQRDFEMTSDPAWSWKLSGGRGKKAKTAKAGWEKDRHVSTAFIRHAKTDKNARGIRKEMPMESLWELGAIHRGSKWQTLNLSVSDKDQFSKAKGFKDLGGGEYKFGDGPILDQVKMVNDLKVPGKVNLVPYMNKDIRNFILGSLFLDMPVRSNGNYIRQGLDKDGDEDPNFYVNKEDTERKIRTTGEGGSGEEKYETYVNALYSAFYDIYNSNKADNKLFRRTDILGEGFVKTGETQSADGLYPIRGDNGNNTDALEEQIICRIINHLKVDPAVKHVTAILVVQILKDSGAIVIKDWTNDGVIEPVGNTISPNKGKPQAYRDAQFQAGYRRFSDLKNNQKAFSDFGIQEVIDAQNGIYDNGADAITGETKIIARFFMDEEGKWKLLNYEYAE